MGYNIMKDSDIRLWSRVSEKIIDETQKVISPLVGNKKGGKVVKMGADGTPTKLIDLEAEEKVIEVLEGVNRPLTLVSEEIGELKIGKGPSEVMFVIDPLDGTSNAVRNIPAYGISVAVADMSPEKDFMTVEDIELGFVKNFAIGDVYSAVKGRGATINGEKVIKPPDVDISNSSIGAYVYRADMEKMEKLCKTVRRMRLLGSVAIELCYVADGTYDAFVDIRGNLRIVDISAAKLILEESGGVVTDEHCRNLQGNLNVLERTSIIAAGNLNLHQDIIRILGDI
jgi:myo-inositol-1(or 4)-monophosphatase